VRGCKKAIMKNLIFAFIIGSGESENEALRLARSIRKFGGEFSFNPIWMLSRRGEAELSEATRQEILSSGARLVTFDKEMEKSKFPFATYVTAAGIAEGLAQGEASYLAMMAADTLILQPPTRFLLPVGKSLGSCPVHLKILGSGFNDPFDEFWGLIYRYCNVDMEQIFAVQTIVDEQPVRAYLNAGLLVVRPERGLLRAWQSDFGRLYLLPEFEPFYTQNELYKIFMHQAVLAGSVLSHLRPKDFEQFPFEYNYPLHLHTRVAEKRRPASLSQLTTCRYEDFNDVFGNPDVDGLIQIDEPLKDWLQTQFK
jgi:hypothetical protein